MTLHRIGRRVFDFERQVAVMAVVNRTPDSFYDHGATYEVDAAVSSALQAAETGADWVDIGGVPFGRGPVVDAAEELDRILPVVHSVVAASDVVVSVDTYRADVARAAVDAGASVINDTSGFADPGMASAIADTGAHVVVTHSAGKPREEKPAAAYSDVVREVREFLAERVDRAVDAGVPREKIIIDPGHDLDKNTLHTLEITRRLDELASLGLPLLAAVSNKDFIGESLDRAQGERVSGSIAAMMACLERGARIVRMHDVAAAVDAARMYEAIRGWRAPVRVEHNARPEGNV
ncbi:MULTISPECIES: dihydropteroate synthase [Micrococcaceae]|uniref:dihydropteroate synthase n=1 Tax=unclassified Kocuria TaxID=2649579 RepID=UPI001010AD0A|nr:MULTISPECIES: dihydropteroate synthase [unclassified Kocuria]